jgi:magnesium transporter
MNFEVMPELTWPWGYPLALALMVVSGVAPLLWFRHKRWF